MAAGTMAAALFPDMEDHWLLEYIDFDSFGQMDDHFGSAMSEDDSPATTANKDANTASGSTTDGATDNTADSSSPGTSCSEASTGEKVPERTMSAPDNNACVEMGSKLNEPLAPNDNGPNDVEMNLQNNQPLVLNQVEEVSEGDHPLADVETDLQTTRPCASQDVDMAFEDNQSINSNQLEEACKDSQPMGDVETDLLATQPCAVDDVEMTLENDQSHVSATVEEISKDNHPLVPNQIKVSEKNQPCGDFNADTQTTQPCAQNNAEMGLQATQTLIADQVEEAPKVDHSGNSKSVRKTSKAGRRVRKAAVSKWTRAPTTVQPNLDFASRGLHEAARSSGAGELNMLDSASHQTIFQFQPLNQDAGMLAGSFGFGPINHQTSAQVPQSMHFVGRSDHALEYFYWTKEPAVQTNNYRSACRILDAGMPVGNVGLDMLHHVPRHAAFQSANQMQNPGIPAGATSPNLENGLPLHISPQTSTSTLQEYGTEGFEHLAAAQSAAMQSGAVELGFTNSLFPQPGFQLNHQPNHQLNHQAGFQANYQLDFQPSYQSCFQPSFQPGHQLGLQPNFQPNFHLNFQLNHQPGFQANWQPNFQPRFHSSFQGNAQMSFPSTPGLPGLSTPLGQASRSRRTPVLAGGQTLPQAINPNLQSSTMPNQDGLETQGQRKVSGEEVQPRRVSAGEKVVKKKKKPSSKLRPGNYILTGERINRSYGGNSMWSYGCSDGHARILTGTLLEKAMARTEAWVQEHGGR